MKLIIAGSREITDYRHTHEGICAALDWWEVAPEEIEVIIEGEAEGPDKNGRRWGDENNILVDPLPAPWGLFPKWLAGHIRNAVQGERGTHLVAIWDGKSTGTKTMIDIMRWLGKPVYIHRV